MQRSSISNLNKESKKFNSAYKNNVLLKSKNSISTKSIKNKLRTKTLENEKKSLSTHKLKKNTHMKTKQQNDLKQKKQKNNLNESEIKQIKQKTGKSRSPTCKNLIDLDNQIKKKRLIRQQRSKSKLSKNHFNHAKKQSILQQNILKQKQDMKIPSDKEISEILKTKLIQREEQKIKSYISQLQNVLLNIKAEKQKTERKSYTKFVQSNKKSIFTERKQYQNHNDLQDVKKSLNFDFQSTPINFKKTQDIVKIKKDHQELQNVNLINQIIDKNKKQKKFLTLKDIRDQYKQKLTASKQKSLTKQFSNLQNQSIKQSKNVSFNQQKNSEGIDGFSYKNGRKLTKSSHSTSKMQHYQQIKRQNKHEQKKQVIQTIIQESMKVEQTIHNEQKKENEIQKKNQEERQLRLSQECSEIKNKKIQKDSFFSQIPSYMKQQKIQDERKNAGNNKNSNNNNILQFLALGSTELKKMFKSKQKKRLVDIQKWKKNFPVGFFESQK